jgi:hypothetical protein
VPTGAVAVCPAAETVQRSCDSLLCVCVCVAVQRDDIVRVALRSLNKKM